ncbi:DUF3772 domain-containing protein [Microbaculum marinum]|uniref:DUF3772 domain-containing protein n=1 Tax=Microbaculum marinum TaxID=1764581 RepID=A0AAW9RDG9_9HYPH
MTPRHGRVIAALVALFALILVGQTPLGAQQSGTQSGTQSGPATDSSDPAEPGSTTPDTAPSASPAAPLPVGRSAAGELADAWKVELDNMALAIDRESISEDQLSRQRARAEEVIEDARRLESELAPEVAAIQDRLNQLGPAPAEGEPPEAPDIAERRAAESAALARADTALKKVRIAIVQAEQVIRDTASLRRARFTRSLTVQSQSVLNPNLWLEGIQALPRVSRSFGILFDDSWSIAARNVNTQAILILLGAALGAVLVGFYLRRYVRRFAPALGESDEVPRLRKLSRAVLVVFTDGLIPVMAAWVLFVALNASGLVSERLVDLNRGVIAAVAVFAFLFGLSRALCAPLRPGWRLLDLSDALAAQTVVTITAIAAVLGIGVYLEKANEILYAPVSLEIAKRALTDILLIALIATGLWRLSLAGPSRSAAEDGQAGLIWTWLKGLIWIVLAVSVVALVAGYIALANFIILQLVFASAVIALVWLLLGLIEELVETILRPESRIGYALASAFGISESGTMQFALIASGALRLAVIVLGATLVLLPWGFDTGAWRIWIQKAFFGLRIGNVTISLSSILAALIILAIGLVATRALQKWLGVRFLPNTKLDLGLRNSIRTIVGYIGIIITAIFAVTYLGFNLQNVAIVAGALSVGIGFGLQSIVNNFVSGLILLAERPIKEGDWIVVGADQGNVRKISIRSTEIETFDRATVIVPNSDLITGTVKNWMHSSMMGRVIVPIGVSYSADPEQVRDILLAIARAHPDVLAYPEPRVYFMDFGDSSLVFNLFAYIGDVNTTLTVRSDFRFEILKRLREANIEIPFPQRDVHLRDIDRLEAALTRGGPGAPPVPGTETE